MKHDLFLARDLLFLQKLKVEVENLPDKIWDYNDCHDLEKYSIKRKKLIGIVMHLSNKISSYISKKYTGNVYLQQEFAIFCFLTILSLLLKAYIRRKSYKYY